MAVPREPEHPARVRPARIAALVAVGVCIAVAIYVYTQFGFDLDPRTLRDRIGEFGWLAPAAYVVVASMRIFLGLPSWVVMSAGGLLFGVWGGFVWGLVGFNVGAALAFGIARGLGRDAVAARLRGRAIRADEYVRARGAPWMALYTAVPISVLTPAHMAAGLSGMAAVGFLVAVFAGLIPRMALYSFFGDAIAQGDWTAVAVSATAIAVLGTAGSIVVRRWGQRRDERAAAEALRSGEDRLEEGGGSR